MFQIILHEHKSDVLFAEEYQEVVVGIIIEYSPRVLPNPKADNDIDFYGSAEAMFVEVDYVRGIDGTEYPTSLVEKYESVNVAREYIERMKDSSHTY